MSVVISHRILSLRQRRLRTSFAQVLRLAKRIRTASRRFTTPSDSVARQLFAIVRRQVSSKDARPACAVHALPDSDAGVISTNNPWQLLVQSHAPILMDVMAD